MDDCQKINLLLDSVRKADEKYDFQNLARYVNDEWDLKLLTEHPEAASIPNRGANYYAALIERGIVQIDLETDKAESESDIIDDGYPLYVWSFEKNYFHFAKELTDALIRQADYFKGESGELPVKVLDSLPFKAGFLSLDIASNGYSTLENYESVVGSFLYEIMGAFFWVEENADNSGKHINICLVAYNGNMYFGTQSFYIPSGSSVTLHDIMDGKSFTKEIFKEYAEMWINILIQHILYLCSDKADITDTGVREKKENFPRRYNKKTDVVEKEVGANISKELAALYNDERIDGVKSKYIRRAHWHNRWVGRLNSPERRLILTWQQPSLVNIRYRAWSELSDEVKDAEEKADHELELQLSHISDKSDVSISYLNKPIPRPNKLRDSKRAYVYPRSKKTAVNALHHAHYQCEISKDHTTFIRKRSNLPYVEPHHLVPLAFQDDFEVSLDREQNIISLCCNCHKKIHLGKDFEELLRTCYELRKDSLRAIGIDISYEELLQMYK